MTQPTLPTPMHSVMTMTGPTAPTAATANAERVNDIAEAGPPHGCRDVWHGDGRCGVQGGSFKTNSTLTDVTASKIRGVIWADCPE
jgi:hypothetical protein